ncbi:MAG: methylenetetrahydrofolate reductase [NAD(P)H] [Clostridia bacterium]|nr:methylenetetrahydrofolate reductase [NAD(P)H] [Clostridia bacterium]
MKIIDILNKREKTLSFEVFPPKKESAFDGVRKATEEIASLKPAFMSVTYGAGGGISQYTIDIAKNINEKYDVPMLAHLTCVASSRKTVAEKIEAMKEAGIENVMALRGDKTPDMTGPMEYQHAYELVRQLKEAGNFCIGGACYPEVHPESSSKEEDLRHLKEKVDAGCDFLTTQMFFENDLLYSFLEDALKVGINVPILPGIMPITNIKQVKRAIDLSSSYLPKEFKDRVLKYEYDPASLKEAGIEYALKQIEDIYMNGISNVHLYSMNKTDVAEKIWKRLY